MPEAQVFLAAPHPAYEARAYPAEELATPRQQWQVAACLDLELPVP